MAIHFIAVLVGLLFSLRGMDYQKEFIAKQPEQYKESLGTYLVNTINSSSRSPSSIRSRVAISPNGNYIAWEEDDFFKDKKSIVLREIQKNVLNVYSCKNDGVCEQLFFSNKGSSLLGLFNAMSEFNQETNLFRKKAHQINLVLINVAQRQSQAERMSLTQRFELQGDVGRAAYDENNKRLAIWFIESSDGTYKECNASKLIIINLGTMEIERTFTLPDCQIPYHNDISGITFNTSGTAAFFVFQEKRIVVWQAGSKDLEFDKLPKRDVYDRIRFLLSDDAQNRLIISTHTHPNILYRRQTLWIECFDVSDVLKKPELLENVLVAARLEDFQLYSRQALALTDKNKLLHVGINLNHKELAIRTWNYGKEGIDGNGTLVLLPVPLYPYIEQINSDDKGMVYLILSNRDVLVCDFGKDHETKVQ